MKNKFEKPELSIINFLDVDIIRTSSHASDPFGDDDDDSDLED